MPTRAAQPLAVSIARGQPVADGLAKLKPNDSYLTIVQRRRNASMAQIRRINQRRIDGAEGMARRWNGQKHGSKAQPRGTG